MILCVLLLTFFSIQLIDACDNSNYKKSDTHLSDTLIELLARRQMEIDQMLEENLREPTQDIEEEAGTALQYQLWRYGTHVSVPIEIKRRTERERKT